MHLHDDQYVIGFRVVSLIVKESVDA